VSLCSWPVTGVASPAVPLCQARALAARAHAPCGPTRGLVGRARYFRPVGLILNEIPFPFSIWFKFKFKLGKFISSCSKLQKSRGRFCWLPNIEQVSFNS
jgi:hypothetical protein